MTDVRQVVFCFLSLELVSNHGAGEDMEDLGFDIIEGERGTTSYSTRGGGKDAN